MNRIKNNESGFSAVEIIMVMVIVGLIGAVGYLVYKNQHKTTKTVVVTKVVKAPASSPPSTQTSTNNNSMTIIKVPELGIEFSAPNSIKDLVYSYRDGTTESGSSMKIADFSTSSLIAVDSDCIASNGTALGGLFVLNGQFSSHSPSDIGGLVLIKQFPAFSVSYGHGQTSCSAQTGGINTSANDILKTQNPLFQNAIKSVNSIN